MRLRRGLAYAAIHLGVAVGLVYWQEVPFWEYIPTTPMAQREAPHEQVAEDPDDRAPMNPCEAANNSDRPTSSQERILAIDNLPIALITGWHLPCSEPSWLDRSVQARFGFTQKSERITGWLISALSLVLWLLVGGYPMIRRKFRRWYTEPGLFMTLFTLAAMLLLGIGWSISLISPVSLSPDFGDIVKPTADVITQLAALPMIFVAAGWVWWVGLFFYTRWKATRRWIDRRTLIEHSFEESDEESIDG
jgi:hypothetical protein